MAFRKDQEVPGFVYILHTEDPDLQNRIKIGLSIDPYERCKKLFSTGVAYPFYVYHAWYVSNMALAEHIAHSVLGSHRIMPNREHFYIVPTKEYLESFIKDFGDALSEEDIINSCTNSLIELIELEFNEENIDYYDIDINSLVGYSEYRKSL